MVRTSLGSSARGGNALPEYLDFHPHLHALMADGLFDLIAMDGFMCCALGKMVEDRARMGAERDGVKVVALHQRSVGAPRVERVDRRGR